MMTQYDKDYEESCMRKQFLEDADPMGLALRYAQPYPHRSSRPKRKPKQPYNQHEYYVALVWDRNTGRVLRQSSAHLRHCREEILSEAATKLSKHMRESFHLADIPDEFEEAFDNDDDSDRMKSRIFEQATTRFSRNPNKKRKGDADRDVSDSGSQNTSFRQDEEDSSDRVVAYRADALDDWEKWFSDAFRAVQQVSCRVIAKEWIKTIHPKKQSTHPYNGKNPRTGERGDSNSTKPPYWPDGVIHKEPDHINKEARTKLLVHLLMNTPYQEMSVTGEQKSTKEITAMTLKESLDQKKVERQMSELKKKFAIVEQIIEVRSNLEQYEAGGLNPETIIQAPNYSDFSRGSKNDEDSDTETVAIHTPDTSDEEDPATESAELEPAATQGQGPSSRAQKEPASETEATQSKGWRKASRNDEPRAPTTTTSRRAHRSRLPSTQYADYALHPPMLPPDWDTFGAESTMLKQGSMLRNTQPSHPPHHDMVMSPVSWGPHMRGQIPEMPVQYTDHCMISPDAMPSHLDQHAYLDCSFPHAQQSAFAGTSQQPQFHRPTDFHPGLHDQRRRPIANANGQFDAFMVQPSQHDHDEMMRRAYFGM